MFVYRLGFFARSMETRVAYDVARTGTHAYEKNKQKTWWRDFIRSAGDPGGAHDRMPLYRRRTIARAENVVSISTVLDP